MKLELLPICMPLSLGVLLIITFSLAVSRKHVTSFLPYISDSGTYPPESCIFGQVLNMFSVLLASIMYLRYRQVKEIFERYDSRKENFELNKFAFQLGLISCLGISVVGNFQETVALIMHWIGSVAAFGPGAIYQCLQTKLSFMIYPMSGDKRVNYLRVFLSSMSALTFASFIPTCVLALTQFKGNDITKWKREDGGFTWHIVSSICEWICAGCTMMYLGLYFDDFKHVTVNDLDIDIETNVAQDINSNRSSRHPVNNGAQIRA